MHWLAYAGTDQVHVNCSDCGWALLNACRWLNLNLDGVRAHRDRDCLGLRGSLGWKLAPASALHTRQGGSDLLL